MAIYFIQFFLIALFGTTQRVKSSDKAKKRFIFFAFFLLIVVAALRSPNIGTDLASHYARRYEQIAAYDWSEIPAFSQYTTYELGYCYFTKLLSLISPSVQFYIAVTSLIIYGVLGFFIYRNSVDVKMSTYILILSCTYYNYMNIIRQALATSLILLGYEILKKEDKKLIRYLIFAGIVVLASSIHTAAIICIIFILFDMLKFTRKQIVAGIVATLLVFVLYQQFFVLILNIFHLGGDYSGYLTKEIESIGHVNLQSISMFLTIFVGFLLGYYYIVFKKKKSKAIMVQGDRTGYSIVRQDSFLLYAGLMASICRLLVFRMNIVNRYSYYFIAFIFLLYPRAVKAIPNFHKRNVVKLCLYILFFAYFTWMTVCFEAKFHQTVPYEFFWQM